jgi:hypothetical protein
MIKVYLIALSFCPFLIKTQCPREDLKVLIEVTNEVAPKLHSHYWLDWQKAPNHLLIIENDREFLFFIKVQTQHSMIIVKGIHQGSGHLTNNF